MNTYQEPKCSKEVAYEEDAAAEKVREDEDEEMPYAGPRPEEGDHMGRGKSNLVEQ